MEGGRRPTGTYRWWLRLQLGLVVAGCATWIVGAVLEEDFVTGAGVGLLVGALALRLGRRAAKDSPHREAGGPETTGTDARPSPEPPLARGPRGTGEPGEAAP